MPRRSNGGLKKEELKSFQELIRNIQLIEIFVEKMSYERKPDTWYENIDGNVNVDISTKPGAISYTNSSMVVIKPYKINLRKSEKTIFTMKVEYRLLFALKDIEVVKVKLENEAVKKFFLDRQIMRFVWPFLRETFNSACGKAGIRPLTLPMLY